MVSLVVCLPRMEHRECCVSEAVREGLVAQEAAAAKAAQEAGGARGLGAHALEARLSSSALQEGAEATAAPEAAARCGRSACPVAGLAAGCCASTPAELVRVSSEGSRLLCFDASGMLCFDASEGSRLLCSDASIACEGAFRRSGLPPLRMDSVLLWCSVMSAPDR